MENNHFRFLWLSGSCDFNAHKL